MNLSSEASRPLRPLTWAPLARSPGAGAAAPENPAEILDAARRQAEEIVAAAQSRAHADAARIADEARERGAAEGRARGEAEAAALRAQAQAVLARARAERRRILAGLTRDVAHLALAVAGRVLEGDPGVQTDAVVALAARLTRRLESPATIRVHPSLAPVLEAEVTGSRQDIRIRPDATVAPGGLILENDDGLVDGTLAERLRRVAAAIGGEDAHG